MARTIRPVRGSTASAALAALSAACAFFTHGAVAGDPTSIRDERGKSLLLPEPSRTPSGLLYEWPYEVLPPARFGGDWSYRLATEFGVLRGENKQIVRQADNFAPAVVGHGVVQRIEHLLEVGAAAGQVGVQGGERGEGPPGDGVDLRQAR